MAAAAAAAGGGGTPAQCALAAAHAGDAGALSAALTAGAPLSTPGLLHEAAAAPTPAALQLLLDRGADVHEVHSITSHDDDVLSTPLHAAAAAGRGEALPLLLARGADLAAADSLGRQAIHLAAARFDKDTHALQLLLDRGADLEAQTADGRTPLMCAVGMGRLPAVELLLDRDASVAAVDYSDQTALHHAAASFEPTEVITSLIAAGSDVTAVDDHGRLPVHTASMQCSTALTALLDGRDPRLRLLSATDADGREPLHCAAAQGCEECVALLLGRGVDPGNPDNDGCTPLHLLASYEDDMDDDEKIQDIFNLLFGYGADARARDNAGDEPIHRAVRNRSSTVMLRLLLDARVDPNAPGAGTPPLHLAARYSEGEGDGGCLYATKAEAVELLLARGADINLLDAQGRRAYHLDGFNWGPDEEDLPDTLVLLMEAAGTRLIVEGQEGDTDAIVLRRMRAQAREEADSMRAGARALLIGAAAEVRRLDAARAAAERAQAAA